MTEKRQTFLSNSIRVDKFKPKNAKLSLLLLSDWSLRAVGNPCCGNNNSKYDNSETTATLQVEETFFGSRCGVNKNV